MFLFELGESLYVSTVKTHSFRKKGLYSACLDENILKFSEKLFYISPLGNCIFYTHFMLLPLSIPAENIRKPEVFWCFQGV